MTELKDTDLDPKWGEASALHDPYMLAHFKARPTDVIITTPPKAGTTWMQQILHQLRTGGDASFNSIFTVVPWLEWPSIKQSWQQRLQEYEAIPDPRVFKTHCTYPQTPGVDVAKIILTSRDPRDCCVSFYHHRMDMTDESCERVGISRPESFDDYFEQWLDFAAWFHNIQSWWPHVNDENVLWLRYEDMKKDMEGSVNKILDFLGWVLSAKQYARVIEYSSFPWMKAHVDKFIQHPDQDSPMFKPGGFIRKGQVGDHKNLLSAEQQARIIEKANEMLEPECLKFITSDVETIEK